MLTGDFNVNLLSFDKNKEVNEFLDLLTISWFTPQIHGPTRLVEYNKPSLVDNTLNNFNDMHCTSGKVIANLTDHLPNFLIIENLNTHLEFKLNPLKRDFTLFKKENLVKDIHELNLMEKAEHVKESNKKYELLH